MAPAKRKAVPSLRTLLYKWSVSVKERDKYKCKRCGYDKDRRFLHAHHLIPKSERFDLAFDIKNGICVCVYCHATFYHKDFISYVFRKPNNVTKKELIEFLQWHKENTMAKDKKEDKMPMKKKDMPMKGKMPKKEKMMPKKDKC